jgi:spore coat protein CotF
MAHWLDKAPPPADAERNFISRTIGLADTLQSHLKNHSTNDAGYLGNEEKVNEIAEYLKKHPNMLKYKFNEQGYLNKIVVNPQWMSFLKDSIERKCNMSSDIVKILQKYATYMYNEMNDLRNESKVGFIDVEMADVKDCRKNINGGKSRRRSKRKASKRKASKRKCKASRRK